MQRTLLVVEDDAGLRGALADSLEVAGYRVLTAPDGAVALDRIERDPAELVITDVHMPGIDGHALLQRLKSRRPELPVLLITAFGTIPKAVDAMRLGAADYLVKPFDASALAAAVARHLPPISAPLENGAPVAVDPRSRDMLALAARVAATDVTLFLSGESGTGKEVMARYVHDHSPRHDGPFVAINCAAIPESMLEATLFGFEKGAFTGALKTTAGKFEQANGGTLLLDEVSEMALGLQAKLLRVLQEREVERVGGRETVKLDVRVLATSNRNLKSEVEAGRFREDLYYRLNVFPLRLPPLRERPADILPLAERLLARAAARAGMPSPRLDPDTARALGQYPFPGNVRELDNLMQRALILQRGGVVTRQELQFEGAPATGDGTLSDDAAPIAPGEGLNGDLKSREYELIASALRSGNRKDAAERLGISPRTLRYKLQRMREEGWAVPA